MARYNTLNLKFSDLQLNKLKLEIKNVTEVTFNLSSNLFSNSNDETNFAHKLLITNTQVSRLRKAFANNLPANIKLSKTQLSKIGESRRSLGRILGPLIKTGFSVIEMYLMLKVS